MSERCVWLSFVDPDKKGPERSLGACIVPVDDEDVAEAKRFMAANMPDIPAANIEKAGLVGAATRKAHRFGCNPGGEVLCIPIDLMALPQGTPLLTLMSAEECERRGLA